MMHSAKKTLSNSEMKDHPLSPSSSLDSLKGRKRSRKGNINPLAKSNAFQVSEKNINGMKSGNVGGGRRGGGKPEHVPRTIGAFFENNPTSETETSETSDSSGEGKRVTDWGTEGKNSSFYGASAGDFPLLSSIEGGEGGKSESDACGSMMKKGGEKLSPVPDMEGLQISKGGASSGFRLGGWRFAPRYIHCLSSHSFFPIDKNDEGLWDWDNCSSWVYDEEKLVEYNKFIAGLPPEDVPKPLDKKEKDVFFDTIMAFSVGKKG
eukprot:2825833-Rhodomonas_salina.1